MKNDDKSLGFTPVLADMTTAIERATEEQATRIVPTPVFGGALVAAILTARELVINKGASDGVKVGMKLRVLAEKPIEIKDPETKKKIGTVDREKVRVEAVTVQEHITICRTYRVLSARGSLLAQAITDMAVGYEERPETLKVEQSNYVPPLAEAESYVKVGDRVELLRGNE